MNLRNRTDYFYLLIRLVLTAVSLISAVPASHAQDQQRIATAEFNQDFAGVLVNALLPLQSTIGLEGKINIVDFRYCGALAEDRAKLLAVGSLSPAPGWISARRTSQSSTVLQQADCTSDLNAVADRLGSSTLLDTWLALAPADAVIAEVTAQWTGANISFAVDKVVFSPTASLEPKKQTILASEIKAAHFQTGSLSSIRIHSGSASFALPSRLYFKDSSIIFAFSLPDYTGTFPKLSVIETSNSPHSISLNIPFLFANEFAKAYLSSSPINIATNSPFGDLKLVNLAINKEENNVNIRGSIINKDNQGFSLTISTSVASPQPMSSLIVNKVSIIAPNPGCSVTAPDFVKCLQDVAVRQAVAAGLSNLLTSLWKDQPLYSINSRAGISARLGNKEAVIYGEVKATSTSAALMRIVGDFTLKLP